MGARKSRFAWLLRQLRDKAELSQPALARRSGLAVSTVRQFEYGLREPTYGTLVKLCKGLGVSLAAFEADDPKPAKPRSKRKTK